jgi:chemotaxis protein CheX
MNVDYIIPFVQAAIEVLEAELNIKAERGNLIVERTYYTTKEVSVLIGITGQVEGTVLYGTTAGVANEIVYILTGKPNPLLNEVSESAIAEIGNIISGRAATIFEEEGVKLTISPPNVLIGRGTVISSVDISRLIIPLKIPFGEIQIAVSMREAQPRSLLRD